MRRGRRPLTWGADQGLRLVDSRGKASHNAQASSRALENPAIAKSLQGTKSFTWVETSRHRDKDSARRLLFALGDFQSDKSERKFLPAQFNCDMVGIAEVIARHAALDDLNGAGAADTHGRVALFAFPLLGFDWLQALGLVLAAQQRIAFPTYDAAPLLCQISTYSA
jgi:hypothetical protein